MVIDGGSRKLVLPDLAAPAIIDQAHLLCGHGGADKVRRLLKSIMWKPNLARSTSTGVLAVPEAEEAGFASRGVCAGHTSRETKTNSVP